MNEIKMIRTDELLHHPDNPRKDLGDLTELTESIRANGIRQNLTVMPYEDGLYFVLIGNRRFEAAKNAGLDKLPCVVLENLTEAEQQSIMLEENIQRVDLTIPEQAKGFQRLIDLGETVEDIAGKTGFSTKTVNHRLNLAKLDEDTLDKALAKQITFTELIELEKIDDIEKRNEILKRNPERIAIEVKWYLEEQEKEKKFKEWKSGMNEIYLIEDMPEDAHAWDKNQWTCVYESPIKDLEVKDDLPKKNLYLTERYERVNLYIKNENASKEPEFTPEEIKRSELKDESSRLLEKIQGEFDLIKANLKEKILQELYQEDSEEEGVLWKYYIKLRAYADPGNFVKELYEEEKERATGKTGVYSIWLDNINMTAVMTLELMADHLDTDLVKEYVRWMDDLAEYKKAYDRKDMQIDILYGLALMYDLDLTREMDDLLNCKGEDYDRFYEVNMELMRMDGKC